jgi:hypothetical protein
VLPTVYVQLNRLALVNHSFYTARKRRFNRFRALLSIGAATTFGANAEPPPFKLPTLKETGVALAPQFSKKRCRVRNHQSSLLAPGHADRTMARGLAMRLMQPRETNVI